MHACTQGKNKEMKERGMEKSEGGRKEGNLTDKREKKRNKKKKDGKKKGRKIAFVHGTSV